MTTAVAVFVAVGVIAAVLLGVALGFDIGALVILAFIVGFALLAVAVAQRSARGLAEPASCPSCGGLISPNAPYCKHCNEVL